MDKALRPFDAHAPEGGLPVATSALPSRLVSERPLLHPDTPGGTDEWGRAGDAAFLAEVLLHRQTETPLCIGLFASPGTGKTTFLGQIEGAVERLGAAAAGRETSFMDQALVVRVDAAAGGEPGALLASAVLGRLAASHPGLAVDLAHAGADPAEDARAANEALDDLRRRHEGERQSLDEIANRDGRLVETVLDAPGSAVDAYARRHRSSIEGTLRGFGFNTADPIVTYKHLVREAADQPGLAARVALSLRALWSYRGQRTRLVAAVLLILLAWGATALVEGQQTWLAAIRGISDKAGPVADWAQAHVGWLDTLHSVALLACLVVLVSIAWRAARFLRPIFKGATLLGHDLDGRRRDLKSLLAHHTRRVDGLAADVSAASTRAADADRRAGTRMALGAGRAAAPAALPDPVGALFAGLTAAMGAPGEDGAPRRLLLLIDDLDLCDGPAAAAMLDATRRLMGRGMIAVVTAARSHLIDGFSDTDAVRAHARFERSIQLGYRIDAGGEATDRLRSAYAATLAGAWAPARPREEAAVDATRTALDRPWRPHEAETLAALSVFAGETPRSIKRFVNLYRIARADPAIAQAPAPVFTALAMGLALDAQGLFDELDALARSGRGETKDVSPMLQQALATALAASGQPVELVQARQGIDVAARYAARR